MGESRFFSRKFSNLMRDWWELSCRRKDRSSFPCLLFLAVTRLSTATITASTTRRAARAVPPTLKATLVAVDMTAAGFTAVFFELFPFVTAR